MNKRDKKVSVGIDEAHMGLSADFVTRAKMMNSSIFATGTPSGATTAHGGVGFTVCLARTIAAT